MQHVVEESLPDQREENTMKHLYLPLRLLSSLRSVSISILLFLVSLTPFAYAQNEKAQQRRANVIFILTDDQGYVPIARHGDVNA